MHIIGILHHLMLLNLRIVKEQSKINRFEELNFRYLTHLALPSVAWEDAMTAEAQDRGAIGDVYGKCCLDPAQEPFYSPTLQERAWTSPIWLNPHQENEESS